MDIKFKWHMFVTSFLPLWLSIIIMDIWDLICFGLKSSNVDSEVDAVMIAVFSEKWINIVLVCGLIILCAVAILWINNFINNKQKRRDSSEKIRIVTAKKERLVSSEYLLAYVLPLIAFDFSALLDVVIFMIFFIVLAFVCVRNDNFYANIFLELKGYRIYLCDIERVIVENKKAVNGVLVLSKNDLRQRIEGNIPGVEFSSDIFMDLEDRIK